jgi:uncharacterized protein with GYD domain
MGTAGSGGASVATFIMLTRLAYGAIRSPEQLEKLEKEVMERIEEGLAGGQVKWLANYAVLGPYDYLDIFEAPDIDAAMKVSAIVRTLGPPWWNFFLVALLASLLLLLVALGCALFDDVALKLGTGSREASSTIRADAWSVADRIPLHQGEYRRRRTCQVRTGVDLPWHNG